MPELPDLLYMQSALSHSVRERTITAVAVRKPILLRVMTPGEPARLLVGARLKGIDLHGPFLALSTTGPVDLVVNLMLAGCIQHHHPGEKTEGFLALQLDLDDGTSLNLCDREEMAKVYLVPHDARGSIPGYATQGVDILSEKFTPSLFAELVRRHGRKQVRSFINNHTILSAIGNAYADEILYEARIHPKTFVGRLTPDQARLLFEAIRSVMAWGTTKVREAGAPIHVKVRDHMRVRNRKGEACPRCGTIIRREGVRGYDVFFCPTCQPATRKTFIAWASGPLPPETTLRQ